MLESSIPQQEINHLDRDWINRVIRGEAFTDYNTLALNSGKAILPPTLDQISRLQFRSECLRDSAGSFNTYPNIYERKNVIRQLGEIGIDMVTVDIYSSPNPENLSENNKETLQILEWMSEKTPDVTPVVLSRAHVDDIEFIKMCKSKNPKLTAIVFKDLSEVRRMVEGWGSFEEELENLSARIEDVVTAGIPVIAFTENLSITAPEHVEEYVISVCEAGADMVGIADTAGRLNPFGAAYLTAGVRKSIEFYKSKTGSNKNIGMVFHAHGDRGYADANILAAISEGATVLDVTTNGLGERVGNANLITTIVNHEYLLHSLGTSQGRFPDADFEKLLQLSEYYAQITGTDSETPQQFVGDKVFTSFFGIHANYFLRVELLAELMEDNGYEGQDVTKFKSEAWKVYSAESPASFGREPDVRIGNMVFGSANVILRLKHLGLIERVSEIKKDSPVVQAIVAEAIKIWGEFPDERVDDIWNSFMGLNNE